MDDEKLVAVGQELHWGPSFPVSALVSAGSTIYAGGHFTQAVDKNGVWIFVNHIAKWDVAGWPGVVGGISGQVATLVWTGTELYAGGNFTNADNVTARNIAKWDGLECNPVGGGLDGPVYAMAVCGPDLYVGGSFTSAGGVPATSIAKWDGKSWSAVGCGANFWIYALAADDGGRLYVAGDLVKACGKAAPYSAQVYLTPTGGEIKSIEHNHNCVVLACVGRPSCIYAFQRATDPAFSQGLTTLWLTNALP